MGTDGDITDAFDDDRLKQAIERAGGEGTWKGGPEFVDPKIQSILDELNAPAPRLQRSKPRKKRAQPLPPADWQHAIVETDQPIPGNPGRRMPTTSDFGAAPTTDFDAFERDLRTNPRDLAPMPSPPELATPEPAPPTEPPASESPAPAGRSVALEFGQTLLVAQSLFVAVTLAHALITGWQADLPTRALIAGLLTGTAWHLIDVSRFSAPVVAVTAHLLTFATTGDIGQTELRAAIGLGLMMTMLGASVIGLSREHRHGSRGVRR